MLHSRLLRRVFVLGLSIVLMCGVGQPSVQAQRKITTKELCARYIKLGMSYREGGDTDNALYFLNKGLNLSRQVKSRYWEAAALEMIGLVNKDLFNKEGAVSNLLRARRLYTDIIRQPNGSQRAIEAELDQAQMMDYGYYNGRDVNIRPDRPIDRNLDRLSMGANEALLAREVETLRNRVILLENENAALREEIAMLRRANGMNTAPPIDDMPLPVPLDTPPATGLLDIDALENMNGFTSLEQALRNPDAVVKLDLQNNGMKTLPADIGRFRNLQYLNVSRNQLTELPKEIGRLSKLQVLNVSENQLDQLPADIGRLGSLKQLITSTNLLKRLPPEVGNLSRLEFLDASGNRLSQVPAALGLASNLRALYLRTNSLTFLPPELGKLKKLRDLDIDDNFFAEADVNSVFATFPDANIISQTQQGAQTGSEPPPEGGQ